MSDPAASNDSFFVNLPTIDNFLDLSNDDVYTPVPSNWHVAVTDVKGSTSAVHAGKYREVNLVGASSIMALLNLKKSFSLPFIFGGDGAAVCLPDSLFDQARSALKATRRMAREAFGLDLRVGIVPVSTLRQEGWDIRVARYRVSEHFTQALFAGGGLQHAESLVKDAPVGSRFSLEAELDSTDVDFSGLECRWKNIPSAHGEIVSIIVQAASRTSAERNASYRRIIGSINDIYGADSMCRPVREENLASALSERRLSGESKIRSFGKGKWYRWFYWVAIRYNVLLGILLMRTGYRTKTIDWGNYKPQLSANTDFKKFDDKIRLTLSGRPDQREHLVTMLEKEYGYGNIVYGIHHAPSALVTCLIFGYEGAHVHLVDADDGGYAIAAVDFKKRQKERESRRR